MTTQALSPALLAELQEHAAEAGCSIEEVIQAFHDGGDDIDQMIDILCFRTMPCYSDTLGPCKSKSPVT